MLLLPFFCAIGNFEIEAVETRPVLPSRTSAGRTRLIGGRPDQLSVGCTGFRLQFLEKVDPFTAYRSRLFNSKVTGTENGTF